MDLDDIPKDNPCASCKNVNVKCAECTACIEPSLKEWLPINWEPNEKYLEEQTIRDIEQKSW